jgi:myosin-5
VKKFNAHVFRLEQDEYIREGIKWTFIDFPDNQPCIDAIESKLGIISLLDEESRLASGSDGSFLRKVINQWATPTSKNVVKPARFGGSGFIVSHYAAQVTYETQGFIEKNRDALPEEHLDMLDTTTNNLLRQILNVSHPSLQYAEHRPFSPARSESDFGGSPSAPAFETSRGLAVHSALSASTSSRPPTPNSGEGLMRIENFVARKQTLGAIFKISLASLMDTISMTNPHYVRCIKPNREKKAWEFDSKHVLSQLRACGILETVRISCAGYPSRWTFDDFASR